jgi:hypothetical protein
MSQLTTCLTGAGTLIMNYGSGNVNVPSVRGYYDGMKTALGE